MKSKKNKKKSPNDEISWIIVCTASWDLRETDDGDHGDELLW